MTAPVLGKRRHSLTVDSLLNLGSQVLVTIVAFFAIPVLVMYMGADVFGLLTLLWAVVGYFSVFDLGISRAITNALARIQGEGSEKHVNALVWTALLSGFGIGLAGATGLWFSIPPLMSLLNVPDAYRGISVESFKVACFGIPSMVIFGIVKGIQAAYGRFELVNAYQSLLGLIQWLGAVVFVLMGYGLVEIIALVVLARTVVLVISSLQLATIAPGFVARAVEFDVREARRLFSFGGWITVSQAVSPLMMYADRFFVSTFVSVAAAGYYAIAQEVLMRILIVPVSIMNAVYPVTSEHFGRSDEREKASELYGKSLHYVLITVAPIIIFLHSFAADLIPLWLSHRIPENFLMVFGILSIGTLFNAIAQVPSTFLHSASLPKVTAVFHLLEVFMVVSLNVVLAPLLGVIGVSIASTVRVVVDAMLLFWGVSRFIPILSWSRGGAGTTGSLLLIALIIILSATGLFFGSTELRSALFIVSVIVMLSILHFRPPFYGVRVAK